MHPNQIFERLVLGAWWSFKRLKFGAREVLLSARSGRCSNRLDAARFPANSKSPGSQTRWYNQTNPRHNHRYEIIVNLNRHAINNSQ
jgi:hypothetical protein